MTDFLFARPSFLEGLARILDIGGTLQKYNEDKTPEEADAKALYNDFSIVGDDISVAYDMYEKSQEQR